MASKTTQGPTKVQLTGEAQKMVDDMKEAERVAGRPKLSDAAAANWLIRLGYETATKRAKTVKR